MKILLSIVFAALFVVDPRIAAAQVPEPIHFTVTVSDTQLPGSPRDRVFTNLSTGAVRIDKGNGIAHSDLCLERLRLNRNYGALPDGEGGLEIYPTQLHTGNAGVCSPGQADLVGEPNSQIVVSFVLPERLYLGGDTGSSYVTTWFDSLTASWGASMAEVNYFDPRNPTTIPLDSTGMASIVLGGIFEVGATIEYGAYQGEATLTVLGDTMSQVIHFMVTVSPYLSKAFLDSDLEITNLVPGTTYSASPDGAGRLTLMPNDGIASVKHQGQAGFDGDPYGHILVTFVLPQRLYKTGGSGFIKVRFDSTSAAWGVSGAETNYFDPREPVSATLYANGVPIFVLGGIFEIDSGTAPGTYEGEALIWGETVTSVGLHPEGRHPKSFELFQNYPNPFNPTTTFRYQIPFWSKVLLRIFDVMGREVATLVNEVKTAGEYTVKWDAGSFPSGVYYYKLEAGSVSDVKKLVLIR